MSTPRTFVFVDLAGYTALTEAHGDEQAADLVARFTALSRAALGPEDRLVKCVGDAVMLTAPTPSAGLELVGRLCSAIDEEPGFPAVRVGLHHGAAIERDGDWFGAAVNLAARVAAEARSGEVLVTATVAAAARGLGVSVEPLGKVRLRHVSEPVDLYYVEPCPRANERVVDPVCRMAITRAGAAGRLKHGDHDHWFCSLECAGAFSADPDRWVDADVD